MFDLYLPPAFPAYLVKSRPESEEGAEGENDEYGGKFRPLRECFEPCPQPLVLIVRPLAETFD
jgi:hypothetical protein